MKDPRFVNARTWEHYDRATPEEINEARAKGRALAEGTADAALLKNATDALEEKRHGYWEAFHEEFVAAAREVPERQAAWAYALGEAFVRARDALATDLMGGSDQLQLDGATEDWQQEADPFSAWARHSPHISWRSGNIWYASQILVHINPHDGLRALDTLPYPRLMVEVLHLYCCDDSALIEEMIKVAPPLVDKRGAWRPQRSIAALLVTDLITEYAKKLHEALAYTLRSSNDETQKFDATRAIKNLEEIELSSWMEHAFNLVLERTDGHSIALGYLGHLSREQLLGHRSSRDSTDHWAAQPAALVALTTTLNHTSVNVAQVREAWVAKEQLAVETEIEDAKRNRVRRRSSRQVSEGEGEGARSLHADGLPFLVGAAMLFGDVSSSEAELASFWSWFEHLLERRDPGLSLITHGNSLAEVTQRFGVLLSRLPSPDGRLRATYEKLEPQRRRALFAHRYEGVHHDLESVVLLRVGLNTAINWLDRVKVGEQANAARELFFWIYTAARRLWLTAVLDTGETKKQLVTACFAFMPLLFGANLGDALKLVIPPLTNDARCLVDACENLRRNGVEAAKLTSLLTEAGADLKAALHDAYQWSGLSGLKQDFPEHLQKLATELGIDFTKPDSTLESERTRRLRETFTETIPWGAALLQRLEVDGCINVRAIPLDQPGSSWVLQVTLPEALRSRFGLSPDIRILAVQGQPRGHDLRRAMAEPEDGADVDPDLLVVASQSPELAAKLPRLAGPWGQRVPWPLVNGRFAPLADPLEEHLPAFDLFERRDPVRGRAFIGRRREVDAIAERLLRGQTVGVFGLRKVGKSSLLQAVAEAVDPAGAALAALGNRAGTVSQAPAEALIVWLDVQSLVVRTRDAVAERLWEGLKERLEATGISTLTIPMPDASAPGARVVAMLRDESRSKDPLDNLRRLLTAALERREVPPICFILDEYDLLFEGYGGEPAMAGVEQIFALLRGLGQATGRVSLALVGRDPVFADQPHLNGFTNPLLGWVEPFHVGPFSDEDATELLQRLGKRVGLNIELITIDLALRWTGGHPLLLREYGAALYEAGHARHSAPTIAAEPVNERAIRIFLRRDAIHTICGEVETLLETRFPESLALLKSVAAAPDQDAPVTLERHGAGGGRVARILFDFGLLRGTLEAPWLPLIYRDYFGLYVPEAKILQRSQTHVG